MELVTVVVLVMLMLVTITLLAVLCATMPLSTPFSISFATRKDRSIGIGPVVLVAAGACMLVRALLVPNSFAGWHTAPTYTSTRCHACWSLQSRMSENVRHCVCKSAASKISLRIMLPQGIRRHREASPFCLVGTPSCRFLPMERLPEFRDLRDPRRVRYPLCEDRSPLPLEDARLGPPIAATQQSH